MTNTYLSFTICSELFAVNVGKVLEVLQRQKITKVPDSPAYIKGIINFRGEVVPVFEMRTRLNLPENTEYDSYVIIIFDLSSDKDVFRIGAIVDRVQDVISFPESEIKPVPMMSKSFNTFFLSGIYKLNEDFILLLNIEKIFAAHEIESIQSNIPVEQNQ